MYDNTHLNSGNPETYVDKAQLVTEVKWLCLKPGHNPQH
jgi:hypothetical protein